MFVRICSFLLSSMSSAAADIIARLVFQNNVDALRDLLKRWKQDDTSENFISSVDEWDLRGKIRRFQRLITGNPPLHLALMLGYKEVVNVLLGKIVFGDMFLPSQTLAQAAIV